MKGNRKTQARTITATLIALLLLAACEGDRKYVSPVGPDASPSPPPVPWIAWSVTGTLTGFLDPTGCTSDTIGRSVFPNGHTWEISQAGSSVTIVTGDIEADFPTYYASLNGPQFDASTGGNSQPWGDPTTNCIFTSSRSVLSGSLSVDGRQLDALETLIDRHSSGVEATRTFHWIGSRD